MTKQTDKKSIFTRFIDGISAIFIPIVNLLSAAGILKGVMLILAAAGVLSQESDTYAVLNAMSDSLFYFLPIILADSCAKKFGANRYTAMVIAGVLLYPKLVALMSSNAALSFIGIPLKSTTYSSTVIPTIAACALLAAVEKLLTKYLPDVIKGFAVPIISIFVVSLATLAVFGPLGAVVSDGLAMGYDFVHSLSPIAAGLVLGATIQLMVLIGVHWSFILIAMNNIALNGEDTILALIGPAIFAQAGAGLAVLIKTKGEGTALKKFRSTAVTGIVSAILGVTEPVMYGVNLPKRKPMIAVCIGGGIGGALVGLSGAKARAFAFPSLASFPVYFGNGFGLFAAACGIGFLSAFIASMLLKYDTSVSENDAPTADNPAA